MSPLTLLRINPLGTERLREATQDADSSSSEITARVFEGVLHALSRQLPSWDGCLHPKPYDVSSGQPYQNMSGSLSSRAV